MLTPRNDVLKYDLRSIQNIHARNMIGRLAPREELETERITHQLVPEVTDALELFESRDR
jgi:hypothetical protein